MNKSLLFGILLLGLQLVICSKDVTAGALTTPDTFVIIKDSTFTNDIQGNNLNVSLAATIILDDSERQNFTIWFEPGEQPTSPPIKINGIQICPGTFYMADFRTTYIDCEREINYSNFTYVRTKPYINGTKRSNFNYFDYYFTVPITKKPVSTQYALQINYTVMDFIDKQGDYYLAALSFPNHKAEKTTAYLTLPSNDSIPRFVPNAKNMFRDAYLDNVTNNVFRRWVFVFTGKENQLIWYSNDEQLKHEERRQQEFWTNVGVKRGLLWSVVIAVILLLFEKLVEWTYGDRIKRLLRKTKLLRCLPFIKKEKVIGNLRTFTYHKSTCNAIKRARQTKTFQLFEEAEAELFTSCKTCHPKEC